MAQPTKPAANGRAAKVLEAARRLFRDGFLAGKTARDLGVESTADSFTFGDELNPLVREAGRCPGFGDDPIDDEIKKFLGNTYGLHGWQSDRPPHLWERGSPDAALNRLYDDLDVALSKMQRAKDEMWTARDQMSSARQSTDPALVRDAQRALELAIRAWEDADKAASTCRGRVSDRAGFLQERFRRQQAAKGK